MPIKNDDVRSALDKALAVMSFAKNPPQFATGYGRYTGVLDFARDTLLITEEEFFEAHKKGEERLAKFRELYSEAI